MLVVVVDSATVVVVAVVVVAVVVVARSTAVEEDDAAISAADGTSIGGAMTGSAVVGAGAAVDAGSVTDGGVGGNVVVLGSTGVSWATTLDGTPSAARPSTGRSQRQADDRGEEEARRTMWRDPEVRTP